jgi:lysophospholipase L1-like esterase
MAVWNGVLGVVAVVGLLLVLAEWAARRAIRRSRHFMQPPGLRRIIHLDPEVHPRLERPVHVDINAEGERGRPLPHDWTDTARVLVTGGSAAECFFNDQDTCWAAVVEEQLRRRGWARRLGYQDVYVGTVARSGLCTAGLVTVLRAILPRYRRLDAIVVMVGASDVLHWLEEGAIEGRDPAPIPVPGIFAQHPLVPFGLHPRRWALAEMARRLRIRLRRTPRVDRNAASWMGRARAARLEARDVRDEVPDAEAMLDGVERRMREVLLVAGSVAPYVLVVRQPWFDKESYTPEEEALFWSGTVGSAFHGSAEAYYSTRVLTTLMGRLDERVRRAAEDLGVPSLDVRSELEMSPRSFVDHFHLTAAGCAAVGRRVADAMEGMVGKQEEQAARRNSGAERSVTAVGDGSATSSPVRSVSGGW